MKLRAGFVSNSSSSSFICAVSGECETYYDGYGEIGAIECENGHAFYEKYAVAPSKKRDEDDFNYDELSADCCPICRGLKVPHADLIRLMAKKLGFDTVADAQTGLADEWNAAQKEAK